MLTQRFDDTQKSPLSGKRVAILHASLALLGISPSHASPPSATSCSLVSLLWINLVHCSLKSTMTTLNWPYHPGGCVCASLEQQLPAVMNTDVNVKGIVTLAQSW